MNPSRRSKRAAPIYIPHAEYFYVFGEVKKPGRYSMEKGTTVLKAITTAGGVNEKAAINKTRIVREQKGAKYSSR